MPVIVPATGMTIEPLSSQARELCTVERSTTPAAASSFSVLANVPLRNETPSALTDQVASVMTASVLPFHAMVPLMSIGSGSACVPPSPGAEALPICAPEESRETTEPEQPVASAAMAAEIGSENARAAAPIAAPMPRMRLRPIMMPLPTGLARPARAGISTVGRWAGQGAAGNPGQAAGASTTSPVSRSTTMSDPSPASAIASATARRSLSTTGWGLTRVNVATPRARSTPTEVASISE